MGARQGVERMDFLITHPRLVWAYFGTFGTIATVLFVLVA
jgi:hypothetical protein